MSAFHIVAGDGALALAGEWEALAERAGASPFLRSGWITAWWRAFGEGALALCLLRDDGGRLAALLPVRRALGTLASPTNWHTPEFGLLAESEGAARGLLESLFATGARRVALAFLDPAQASAAGECAARSGYRVLRRTLQRSPTLALDCTWEDYERRLARRLRADLARQQRRLAARGRMSFEVAAELPPPELEAQLAEGFAIEDSGWKDARGTAIRSQAHLRRFYGEVARWAAARGWLRLAFLRLDGRALAFDLGLEHAGVHYLLKTGYDPAFAALGPGKLLRREMIARAFRAGLARYELLGDHEPWKLQWTRATRARELVQGFAPSLAGRLDRAWFAHGRPLAKRLKDLARLRRDRAAPAAPVPLGER